MEHTQKTIDELGEQFMAKAMELGMDCVLVGYSYQQGGKTYGRVFGKGNAYARQELIRDSLRESDEFTRVVVRLNNEE